MNKIIILSTDVVTDLNQRGKKDFENIIHKMIDDGNKVVFTSRNNENRGLLSDVKFIEGMYFKNRSEIKEIIRKASGKYFVMVGNKDVDLYLAANNKMFFVVPQWCRNIEKKAIKYGIDIDNLEQFYKLISIIGNQNSWFYRLDLDEKTTILSLTNANNYKASKKENEMINEFRDYLKRGNKRNYKALLYHFLAAISNNEEFREVTGWGIFPSSGTGINEDLSDFKEKARILMNGKKSDQIFIRHIGTWKSHEAYIYNKDRLPADRHFDTIIINPVYKDKLKDRVVCIFDDYLTNGTSFEAARNLLLHEGVKKIFFVSLGKFHKNRIEQYYMQNYIIKGNLYEPGYSYTLKDSKWFNGRFNYKAVTEIESLYDILYL